MSCILCKNISLNKIYAPLSASGRVFCRCTKCGLFQINPVLTDAELSAYYQKYDVMGEREPYYQALWEPDAIHSPEGKDIVARFAWAKKFCGSFKKTLDVGSGPGLFLGLVKDDGGTAVGCELNARAAKKSAEKFNTKVYAGTIESVEENDFDVITLWDLLEHVANPNQLIQSTQKLLKLGGWLFIETPNESSLLDAVIGFLIKIGICRPAETFYGLHHLVLFRPQTITKLLEDNGFKIIKIDSAETTISRIFRKNTFRDKIMRVGVGGLFLVARLVGKQNKMLIVARKN